MAVLGCAWAVYTNVFGASIYPAVTASGVDSVDTPPPNESAKRKTSFALLAAAYPPAAAASQPELTFAERLAGLDRPSVASVSQGNLQANIDTDAPGPSNSQTPGLSKSQDASPPPAIRQVASIPVPPRRAESRSQNKNSSNGDLVQRAKATVLANTGSTTPSIFERLFGKSDAKPESHGLAYASADAGVQSDGRDTEENPSPRYDRMTAVYDISAHTVYMPDGTKLEAHSGLGSALDDPRHVRERDRKSVV